ncbi:aldehyde dehydrogenase family protein [Crenobacter cavernae]|uniref:aldehyde dehydrogenase family protein n=1 Tax=Crenobacter cavernae TaxID=2290923 RepID=UPI0023EA6072|nr:aldehyde dehydrogenase family protein [Crenobacter cavernae]
MTNDQITGRAALFKRYALRAETRDFLAEAKSLWLDGRWQHAEGGRTFAVEDPASGVTIANVAEASAADVGLAVAAARRAFESGPWPKLRPRDRERLLTTLAELVEADMETLAELETLDNGKPLSEARDDIAGAVDYLRYLAGWATKLDGGVKTIGVPGSFAYTRLEPVGVVGAIVPWNFPFSMALWKIAPCLATGCTVVLKPAEQTPLTALRLAELIEAAGYPAGVVNIVTGVGPVAGAALVSNPDVDKIAFTGSTRVGREIGAEATRRLARVTLELGGKSPVLVFDDADVDAAIAGACNAIFYNQGQVCTAGSRLYVHKSRYREVVDAVASYADSLELNHGFADGVGMGPLVSAAQRATVERYIDIAEAEGAVRLTRARKLPEAGHFVAPTVFADVKPGMRCVEEEIFGPVLVCASFDTDEEAIELANATRYGLAASVWTRSLSRAHSVSAAVRAGTVWVNNHWVVDPAMPFGGVGQSGVGRELGREQLDAYLETKSVTMLL